MDAPVEVEVNEENPFGLASTGSEPLVSDPSQSQAFSSPGAKSPPPAAIDLNLHEPEHLPRDEHREEPATEASSDLLDHYASKAGLDPSEVKHADSPRCAGSVVSSSLLAISVDDPRVEGGKLNSYITYCLSVRPAMSGVSHVRRRYSDFEWLRKQLCSMFPGVFMPPLPEKKLFGGRDEDFIKERTVSLERFMNRVAALPFCCSSEMFQIFISRHENSLEAAKKEVEKIARANEASGGHLARYADLFPTAFSSRLSENAEEEVVVFRSFLEKSDADLQALLKTSMAMHAKADEAAREAVQLHTLASKLDRTESEYVHRPEPRPDVLANLERWASSLKNSAQSFKLQMLDNYRHELEDTAAMLEVIKQRDAMKAVYDKWKVKADKWRALGSAIKPTQAQQKDDDLTQEDSSRYALEVVTKVLLTDQAHDFWKHKMHSYRCSVTKFAQDSLEHSKAVSSTWEAVARWELAEL